MSLILFSCLLPLCLPDFVLLLLGKHIQVSNGFDTHIQHSNSSSVHVIELVTLRTSSTSIPPPSESFEDDDEDE